MQISIESDELKATVYLSPDQIEAAYMMQKCQDGKALTPPVCKVITKNQGVLPFIGDNAKRVFEAITQRDQSQSISISVEMPEFPKVLGRLEEQSVSRDRRSGLIDKTEKQVEYIYSDEV